MVPNPYLLLAIGVACGLAAWGGYRHGVQTADDACTARAAQAAHAAAVAAREHAEAESARRIDEAARMAASAAASREARLRGQLNALRHAPRPDCALPADRLRDYAESVRAANQLDAPERVPRPCPQLPAPTDADEIAVTLWTIDLIDAAAECRRMHETCRNAAH